MKIFETFKIFFIWTIDELDVFVLKLVIPYWKSGRGYFLENMLFLVLLIGICFALLLCCVKNYVSQNLKTLTSAKPKISKLENRIQCFPLSFFYYLANFYLSNITGTCLSEKAWEYNPVNSP